MAYDLEEQEKLDALRDWWARHGTLIVVVVLAAAASMAGWRGWQWYQGHKAGQAMGYFEALENAAVRTDDEALARIRAASDTLRSDFPKSAYTSRGLLLAAQALHAQGYADEAAGLLEWLVANSPDTAITQLARLRLAGVLLALERHADALAQLNDPPAAFTGLYADRRGDILRAQGKNTEAAAQWRQALDSLQDEALASIIQLKLDAIGGA